ncbi:beta-1,3-galactosyltransferase 1-like [Magallana gigas]|uniref:beta-1,3-galactosyltransferase 1-like n=1 Tax=Magallana gigas TaxID=29159 RepID=UPI00333EB77E
MTIKNLMNNFHHRRLAWFLGVLTTTFILIVHLFNTPGTVISRSTASFRYQRVNSDDKKIYSQPISVLRTDTTDPQGNTGYPLTLVSPYLINNPSICKSDSKLNFLFILQTSTDHFKRRRAIRKTWGNTNIFRNISFRIAFFFGQTSDKEIQMMLENESTVYGDIIQGQFIDSYHNLTHKGVLTYRWISEFCSNVEMVVKVDDDMFVNVFNLLEYYLPLYHNASRKIMGHLRPKGTSRIMRENGKWKVHANQFKNMTHYPVPYCNGYFVLISADIIHPMYKAAFSTPFFWVEDVYLYGLLPAKIGNVQFTSITANLTLNQETGMKCYTGNTTCKYLASQAEKQGYMESMWFAALKMYRTIA